MNPCTIMKPSGTASDRGASGNGGPSVDLGISDAAGEIVFPRRQASIISPLRYPGSKRRHASYVGELLRLNGLRPRLYVEPFAGGASVALQLLNNDLVEAIGLDEKDPLVASFWRVAFFDSKWLVDAVRQISVTLERWDYYRSTPLRTERDQAIACLFLNRTSFSGILARRAGPIGGRAQVSQYRIDCRFPRETLVRRIEQAATLADRVQFVECADWHETIHKPSEFGLQARDIFYYLDPPFFHKAKNLYRFAFGQEDHVKLQQSLMDIDSPWLLSYDPAEAIIQLYSQNGHGPTHLQLLYTASGNGKPAEAQEVIMTNVNHLPDGTRLWRSSAEWRQVRAPRGESGDAVGTQHKGTACEGGEV
jgi:DNA adenine methylase